MATYSTTSSITSKPISELGSITVQEYNDYRTSLSGLLNSGNITPSLHATYIRELDKKPIININDKLPTIPLSLENEENLSPELVRGIISSKPRLITKGDLFNLGNKIKLVNFDSIKNIKNKVNKSFSPRLLNYVEPYDIKGFDKTLFYTEVNSGLKVGDRVFIINGNYDNDLLIKSDKYKKGRDGYKVLYVENCKIVLDIDYTGEIPYNDEDDDEFIKVYYIRDQAEFIQANRQITTRDGVFDYKFSYYQNNIIFTDTYFTPMISSADDWGFNNGINPPLNVPGFFVRDSSVTIPTWTEITTQFVLGSYSYALSPSYSNNDRIKIMNDSFIYNGKEYKNGFVYKWEVGPTQSDWVVDVTYHKPLISKSNFRDGNFKGIWNTGLFGRQDKKIKWEGEKSTWSGGTLLNTTWEKGTINSAYTLINSYYSLFDSYGLPFQKENTTNNNGRGFNFIIDSEFITSTINNGTVLNTSIGTQSATFSVVENHLLSINATYSNKVNKGYFESCKFNNTSVNNSEISNSRSNNTKFTSIKSINSHFDESVIKDSSYTSDNIIKIIDYDEWSLSNYSTGVTNKVYKFYLTKEGYKRLKNKDFFYIKGLLVNDKSKNVINFFDKKFILSSWVEYIDDYSGDFVLTSIGASNSFYKRGVEFSSFLSTPAENEYRITTVLNGSNYETAIVDENPKMGYSLDIVLNTNDILGNSLTGIDFNRDKATSSVSSPTMSNYLGNIIDFSKAYIIDSDFESGILETSNWNSGINIEFNNDVNITENTNIGKYYNLIAVTSSSTIIATISTYNSLYPESGDDCLAVGKIVYLDSVYYDTLGRVDGIVVNTTSSGTLYTTTTGLNVSGTTNGSNLTVDIIAATVGSVISYGSLSSGSGYSFGTYTSVSTTTSGLGTGLTLDVTVSTAGGVISVSINNPGSGYSVLDSIDISGISNTTLAYIADISVQNGEVLSASINQSGVGYSIGDSLIIQSGNYDAVIIVTSVTGSMVRLPDNYKITSNDGSGGLVLEEVITGSSSIISSLDILDGGLFYTKDAQNRYGYLHKLKINKSKIKSGLFRRTFFKNSLIENDDYNVNDIDYSNLEKIRNLVVSDSIFLDNSNILSSAVYLNSHFVKGGDIWTNGIVQNSVWNGMTFSNGTIKESRWVDGKFNSGLFYNSKTFDSISSEYEQNYYTENTLSYYKDGLTTATISNNRYSWQNGQFGDSIKPLVDKYKQIPPLEFYKSDWENGTFSNGRFYYSKWYNGILNGGNIGDISIPSTDTLFYNGTIDYTIVDNATLYSSDTSYAQSTNNSITWNNGIFNSGVFGSDISQTASNSSIWYGGVFNGGEFTTNARWKNGVFNGGKFISGYGWTMSSSTYSTDYGWENGVFNGGEFGNANTATNSTWFTGEFDGGLFKGRVWNNGTFKLGDFNGSATYSSVGGLSSSNASDFINSFSQSYYGLWRDGFFTNIKDKFIKDKKIFTEIERSDRYAIKKIPAKVNIKNGLWVSGTFSNPNGEMNNCVWLDGTFEKGTFKNSSFNPYVSRDGGLTQSFNLNDTCIWKDGNFDGGDFYISNWETGNFIIGTGHGMIWKNGICSYMNAFNIYWENGLWRNGNWYGSSFEFGGEVTDDYTRQILFRGMSWSGTSSCHVWNVFEDVSTEAEVLISYATASTPGVDPFAIAEISSGFDGIGTA